MGENHNHPNGYIDFKILNYFDIGIEEMVLFYAIAQRWSYTVSLEIDDIPKNMLWSGGVFIPLSYQEAIRLTRRHDKRYNPCFRLFEPKQVAKYFNRLIDLKLIERVGTSKKYYYRPDTSTHEVIFTLLPQIAELKGREKVLITHLSNSTKDNRPDTTIF
jgi:hypothetical protein